MKILMQACVVILISCTTFAYAETPTQSGNIAVHIAKTHYLHPVRLLHPYLDVWHMKGPLAEKAAMASLEKRFTHVSECTKESEANVVLLLEPHLFYNPQLRVFHAEYIARVYTDNGEPITRIKEQSSQMGELSIASDFFIEKSYAKAMDKVIETLSVDSAFLANLNQHKTIKAGALCNELDYLPLDKLYY